ncbi:MAG: pilin [Minisyncoccia bacterium]|jgi:hypothetical protein
MRRFIPALFIFFAFASVVCLPAGKASATAITESQCIKAGLWGEGNTGQCAVSNIEQLTQPQCVAAEQFWSDAGGGTGQCFPANPSPAVNQNLSPAANSSSNQNVTLINPLGAGTNLSTLLAQVLQFVVYIGSIVVIVMLVYVGFMYVMAQGKPESLTKAHNALLWTIVGALILLGAQAISLGIQATVQALSGGATSSSSSVTPSTGTTGGATLFPGVGQSAVPLTQSAAATLLNQQLAAMNSACSQNAQSSQCISATNLYNQNLATFKATFGNTTCTGDSGDSGTCKAGCGDTEIEDGQSTCSSGMDCCTSMTGTTCTGYDSGESGTCKATCSDTETDEGSSGCGSSLTCCTSLIGTGCVGNSGTSGTCQQACYGGVVADEPSPCDLSDLVCCISSNNSASGGTTENNSTSNNSTCTCVSPFVCDATGACVIPNNGSDTGE